MNLGPAVLHRRRKRRVVSTQLLPAIASLYLSLNILGAPEQLPNGSAPQDRRETPVGGVFPARSKLHRAQTGARLRVAPGTCVPAVAVRATEIPTIQPLYRGFPGVSPRINTHPEPAAVTAQAEIPSPDAAHIALVSEMIARDIPTHPTKDSLAQIIVSESRKVDVDPLFIAAIVRAESMFKHKAVSRRGAQGLMQIMPSTGRFIAKHSKIELKDGDALHNPETNIKLGVWYVRYLLTKFKGDRTQMLVAYNWGPTNMLKALSAGTTLPHESVQYVHKVLSHHTTWTQRFQHLAALPRDSSLG